jgi:hypothetical protein
MRRMTIPLASIGLFIGAGCSDQGTEPQVQHAVTLRALLVAAPAQADVTNLNFVSVATGLDRGPQDGIFDVFTIPNLGSVNNNGFASFRTAVEFSLADLPTGSTINAAELTVVLSNFEGTRSIEVHGYAGDGTVQLSDLALNGLVGTASVDAGGTQTFVLDATSFVTDLVANGETFAGFNVREEPANASNFTVMSLELIGAPVLSIRFSTEQILDIDIKPGSVPNSINPRAKGKVPVAILSSVTFDAPSAVDAASLTFGRTGNETSLAFCIAGPEDVNGDGLLDMVCHFNTDATGFLPGDTEGVLKGETLSGLPIKGIDSVRIIP